MVFEAEILNAAGVTIADHPGDTPDDEVNTWHRDLIVSAGQLADIADAMWSERQKISPHLDKEVAGWIAKGIAEGQIDRGKTTQGVLDSLKRWHLVS